MKSVLISIQPKWVEKICKGEKTIEVRKTRPKLETPFKVYIYCTKHKERLIEVVHKGDDMGYCVYNEDTPMFIKTFADMALLGTNMVGKVIGEFVCDRIEDFSQWEYDYSSLLRHINLYAGTNGDYKFLDNYLKGEKYGYAWHISDLKIYDKPKELSEFYTTKCDMPCEHKKRGFNMDFCMAYENGSHFCKELICDKKRLKRPPQSWQFIEAGD
jgi:predicted transcriptional regulator